MASKTTITCDDCEKTIKGATELLQWEVGPATGAVGTPIDRAIVAFEHLYMLGAVGKRKDLCRTCFLRRIVALGKRAAKKLKEEATDGAD